MKKYKYQWENQRFPLHIPRGPRTELKGAYKEFHLDVIPPPKRESPANRWILDKSWKEINQ